MKGHPENARSFPALLADPMDDTRRPARPLVVRCGAMGDMVMVTTLLRVLAARHGAPVDVLSSGAWTPDVLAACPDLGHLQLLASRKAPYLVCPSQWRAVRWLRRRGRGPVYVCDTDDAIRALLARGRVRAEDTVDAFRDPDAVGAQPGLYPDKWLALGQRDPGAGAYGARALPAPERFRLPRLLVPEAARAALPAWLAAQRLEGPLVLFQPGNKRTHKRGAVATRQHPKHWPPERWAALARAVWERLPEAQVLLCGSPREHGVLEEIRAATADARLHNLARVLPIPRLFALLERAHSLVSVDTGPAHAAAALGCPLVVLFGAAPPAQWRPIGPGPITVLGGERGADSRVEQIPAEAVIAAWRALPPRDPAGASPPA
jgi:heptosyltransferase-2/heptosyltransferase-3